MKKNQKNGRKMTMNNVFTETVIDDNRWLSDIPEMIAMVNAVKNATFSFVGEHENIDVLQSEKPLRITLCLSNDEGIQKLNRDFRGKDMPTNVLTFANVDSEGFNAENMPFEEIDLGNIIISYETMIRESIEEKITLRDHFCHLLVHGMLHILGYDHMEEQEAQHMESLEVSILEKINIKNPYKED